MRTPASISGHPIHAMLIVFPVGLFIFSLICDLCSTQSANPATWALVAFYTMVGGFIGALAAAIPGLIDLLSLADKAIKKTAITHMSINLVAVALYAVNIWMRMNSNTNTGTPRSSPMNPAAVSTLMKLGSCQNDSVSGAAKLS